LLLGDWRSFAAVAAGGALGATARFAISLFVAQRLGLTGFPAATLFINITGSLFIGAVAAIPSEGAVSLTSTLRAFIAAGILGGFTTFSTFSLETLTLARTAPTTALIYVLTSVIAGVAAAWAGFTATRSMLAPPA
jgi:CrcB protein